MAAHRLEAIHTEAFITSFAISAALGADAKFLTFIDVCSKEKESMQHLFRPIQNWSSQAKWTKSACENKQ